MSITLVEFMQDSEDKSLQSIKLNGRNMGSVVRPVPEPKY